MSTDDSVETPTVADTPGNKGRGREEELAGGTLLANRYEIVRFVARGGMGEIYEARDIELRTRLAVKTVRAKLAADPSMMERVRREVQLARSVTHPNVCRIFDIGHAETEGRKITFITMELLEGVTLFDRLRQHGRCSPAEALPLATDIIAGLGACHRAGVIHRDLKSENVLLVTRADREHAVLTDFGIARLEDVGGASRDAALTREGSFIGSPAFMAPELVDGARANVRSDIYSLGTLLWELVVGIWPLRGKETLEIVRALATAKLGFDLPAELDPVWATVIRRCLASAPEARFGSAVEVLEALAPGQASLIASGIRPTPVPGALTTDTSVATIATTAPGPAAAASIPTRTSARAQHRVRRPLAAVAALGAAGLIGGGAWWYLRPTSHPPTQMKPAVPTVLDVETHLGRLEFAKAREQARQIDRESPGTGAYLLARAEAGLGNWREAAAAASRARTNGGAATRPLKLELDAIEKRTTGGPAEALPLLEALYATSDKDARLGLAYAETLIGLGQGKEATSVLDAIAATSPDEVTRARIELAYAMNLYTTDGSDRTEFARHGAAAIAAAQAAGATVIEGRARSMHAMALAYQGAVDTAIADAETAIKLATEAGDRPGLAVALRMRGFIKAIANGDRDKALVDVKQAVELSGAVGSDLDLALAQNILGGMLSDTGRSRDAADMWEAAAASAVRAHREDIANNRPRPNLASMLIYLGAINSARKILTDLRDQRGPDLTGRQELNLAALEVAGGNLPAAKTQLDLVAKIIETTKNQQWRAAMYIESARLALEAGNAERFHVELAKAEAQFKAMGEGAEDFDVLILWATDLLASDPAAVAQRLVNATKQPMMMARGIMICQRARAQLRNGQRAEALAGRKAYRDEPLFEQYSAAKLEARLLDAELADDVAEMDVSSRELGLLRESMRAEGFKVGRWRAELGLAQLSIRRGDPALAATLARGVEQETRAAGYLRLAGKAHTLSLTLARH